MDKSIATTAPYFDAGEVGRELVQSLDAQERGAAGRPPGGAGAPQGAAAHGPHRGRAPARWPTARAGAAPQGLADLPGRADPPRLRLHRHLRLPRHQPLRCRAHGHRRHRRLWPRPAGALSDVDLLFLLPYKQTPWGESVVEYMLYLLWDLGLKVGHATRTVDQSLKLARADVTIRTALLDSRLDPGRRAAVRAS